MRIPSLCEELGPRSQQQRDCLGRANSYKRQPLIDAISISKVSLVAGQLYFFQAWDSFEWILKYLDRVITVLALDLKILLQFQNMIKGSVACLMGDSRLGKLNIPARVDSVCPFCRCLFLPGKSSVHMSLFPLVTLSFLCISLLCMCFSPM